MRTDSVQRDRVELARDAFARGRAEASQEERLRWLDRAHRILPADPTFALALAQALLGRDDARAVRVLEPIVARHDVREAFYALAAARLRLGQADAAAEALSRALSRHALPPALAPLADAVARAAGFAGWCALRADGAILWGPAGIAVKQRVGDGPEGPLQPCGSPAQAASGLNVTASGRALLGSPLSPAALRAVDGFVALTPAGGLRGWAWHPGNPDLDPTLYVRGACGGSVTLQPRDTDETSASGLLARPRRFTVSARTLARLTAPLKVLGPDGDNLFGSPIDPSALASAADAGDRTSGPPDEPPPLPKRVDVIVGSNAPVALRLPTWAHRFTADIAADGVAEAVNPGLQSALAADRDVVVLNGTAQLAPESLEGLQRAAYASAATGLASAIEMPVAGRRPPAVRAGAVETTRPAETCLYIRRDCLRAVGQLRSGLFAQGPQAVTEFCVRARKRGWRHVTATGVVAITPESHASSAERALRRRNDALLRRVHPGAGLRGSDEETARLIEARRSLDAQAWRTVRQRQAAPSVLLITHDQGGGVERALAIDVDHLKQAGISPLILRPARHPDGQPAVKVIPQAETGTYPSLIYALPDEYPALLRLLQTSRPVRVVFHHLLGHASAILDLPARLSIPYDVHVQDYALLCPRVQLMGPAGRYCGEPDLAGCRSCIATMGSLLDEKIGVTALRTRSAGLLAGAQNVIAPSPDAARRIARHFPGVTAAIVLHEDDAALARVPLVESRSMPVRIVVVGGLTAAKGYETLCACADDAARRDLPLRFVVVGHTIDDSRLLASGRAFVTGPFEPDEAESLIRAQAGALAFIPSVWPETWCYALGDAWRAGLRAAAFDIGAPAARIRATGRGIVLPLGLSPARINRALLAAAGVYRHEDDPLAETRTGT